MAVDILNVVRADARHGIAIFFFVKKSCFINAKFDFLLNYAEIRVHNHIPFFYLIL